MPIPTLTPFPNTIELLVFTSALCPIAVAFCIPFVADVPVPIRTHKFKELLKIPASVPIITFSLPFKVLAA